MLQMIAIASTTTLERPKGNPIAISRINNNKTKPAAPMELQHNHFSMENPLDTTSSLSTYLN